MSKICEFKKGNWLFRRKLNDKSDYNDSVDSYGVDQIDNIIGNCIAFSQSGAEIKVQVEDILPIPLTDDILSNHGFELVLAKDGIIVYSKELERGKIFVSNMHGKGWKLSSDLDSLTYFDVPYVHIMQNKYKRLTQTEWDVNLSNVPEYLSL